MVYDQSFRLRMTGTLSIYYGAIAKWLRRQILLEPNIFSSFQIDIFEVICIMLFDGELLRIALIRLHRKVPSSIHLSLYICN